MHDQKSCLNIFNLFTKLQSLIRLSRDNFLCIFLHFTIFFRCRYLQIFQVCVNQRVRKEVKQPLDVFSCHVYRSVAYNFDNRPHRLWYCRVLNFFMCIHLSAQAILVPNFFKRTLKIADILFLQVVSLCYIYAMQIYTYISTSLNQILNRHHINEYLHTPQV